MTGTDPMGLGLPLVGSYDVGRCVECDSCGADLTDDTRTGGFMFSSSVYGHCCAEKQLASIRGYGEEHFIRGWCTPGMAFADWIREIRNQVPGGNTVRVYGSKPAEGSAS